MLVARACDKLRALRLIIRVAGGPMLVTSLWTRPRMSQPSRYDRSVSFTNLQAAAPTAPLPGAFVDAEFNAVKTTLDAVLANLRLVQRDDGRLKNRSVGRDQLSPEIEVGWEAPTVWVTATAYVVGNTVFNGSGFYRCLVAHTSGTFATDLAALKWELIVNLAALTIVAASQIANTPAGGIAATTVQAAIDELEAEKAASSHTHPASAISDSTAAGRDMLTAADLAAQKTLLGLGALAFLSSVPITAIGAEIALTGDIAGALSADANDWAPTGIATASIIRVNASSAVSVSGLLAAAVDGTLLILDNVGAFNVTLLASSASSAAANRFLIPRPIVLGPNQSVTLKYDLTAARWRSANPVSAQPLAAGFKNLTVTNVATVNVTAPATPNSEMKIVADSILLEDTNGEAYQARSVNVTIASGTAGANGIDTGAVANSTGYFLWVIYNPTTNTVAGLMSTSATAPTMPSGYTFKARVGWNRTNGSAQFHRVVQIGNKARYAVSATITTVLPNIANGVAGTWSDTAPTLATASVAALVPATASEIVVNISNRHGGSANAGVLVAPTTAWGGANNGPAGTAGAGLASLNTGSATNVQHTMALEANTIAWASSAAGGAVSCAGWTDNI